LRSRLCLTLFPLGRCGEIAAYGAPASCAIYSLIEAAKQNDLNPFAYLYYALDRAPRTTSDADWDELLPGNLTQEIISANYPIPGRLV